MNKEKKQKNDKQIFRKWVLRIIAGFIVGLLFGLNGNSIADGVGNVISLFENIKGTIPYVVFGIFAIINILVYTVSFSIYGRAKKMKDTWNGNEEVLDEIEEKLGHALLPVKFMSGINYFLFALHTYTSMIIQEQHELGFIIIYFMGILVFFVSEFTGVALQKKVVDMLKQLNPEKKGNIFDFSFNKDWVDSCDEAQQAEIYKCGYKGYLVGVNTCQVLLVFTIIGMMIFDTGLFPVFCVTVVMVAMVTSYTVTSIKLEKSRK